MANRGGMNPDMMKQLQQMQGRIAEAQAKLEETVQGKGVRWWARRAVQARKDANARGRTIRRWTTMPS